MARGIVKWFDASKGYGFIVTPEGQEVFVNCAEVHVDDAHRREYGPGGLKDGEEVTFELAKTEARLEARAVRPVRPSGHQAVLLSEVPTDSHLVTRVSVEFYLREADLHANFRQIDRFQRAIDALMTAFGFEPDPEAPPFTSSGSWYAKLFYRPIQALKAAMSSAKARTMYAEMEEAIRRKTLDQFGADASKTRSEAVCAVLHEFQQFQHAVVRVGDLLIAKGTVDGQSRLLVETLSPELARQLDRNPQLMRDPVALFSFVDGSTTKKLSG